MSEQQTEALASDRQAVIEPASAVEVVSDEHPDFLGGSKLEDGIGLCLSGGGFRAMLFHLGALFRLNEIGLFKQIQRVSSVSGGSIAAGALGMAWDELTFDADGVAQNLLEKVGNPLLDLSRRYVDGRAILIGMLPFVSASGRAAAIYDKVLFKGKTLQDLPTAPRFTFTATCLQSCVLWRFARDYAANWRVGLWPAPELRLADVVAASAAFPPYLSPAYIKVPANKIERQNGVDLHRPPFTTHLRLTDGGVYDNMGLEPIWKRYRIVLVSDGGLITPPAPKPWANWLSMSMRVANISLQEGINTRRRVLLGLERMHQRRVVYWGIGQDVDSYKVGNPLNFHRHETELVANVPTRLKRYPRDVRQRILCAGYAHADAALRASGLKRAIDSSPSFAVLPLVE